MQAVCEQPESQDRNFTQIYSKVEERTMSVYLPERKMDAPCAGLLSTSREIPELILRSLLSCIGKLEVGLSNS